MSAYLIYNRESNNVIGDYATLAEAETAKRRLDEWNPHLTHEVFGPCKCGCPVPACPDCAKGCGKD